MKIMRCGFCRTGKRSIPGHCWHHSVVNNLNVAFRTASGIGLSSSVCSFVLKIAPGRALTPAPLRNTCCNQYGRGRGYNLTPIAHIRPSCSIGDSFFRIKCHHYDAVLVGAASGCTMVSFPIAFSRRAARVSRHGSSFSPFCSACFSGELPRDKPPHLTDPPSAPQNAGQLKSEQVVENLVADEPATRPGASGV